MIEGMTVEEVVDYVTHGMTLEEARKIMMEREDKTSEQLDEAADNLMRRPIPKELTT